MRNKFAYFIWVLIATCIVTVTDSHSVNAESVNGWSQKTTKATSGSREKVDQSEIVAIATRLSQALESVPSRESKLPKYSLASLLSQSHANRIDLSKVVTQRTSLAKWKVSWNESNGTPIFISDMSSSLYKYRTTSTMTTSESVISFINSQKNLFRLSNPNEELIVRQELVDSFGKRHIVFQQQYQGILVWGHELVAHLEPNGDLYLINGRYSPTPEKLDMNANKILADQALDIALDTLSTHTEIKELSVHLKHLLGYDDPTVTLCIWVDDNTQEPHLAWHIQIRPNIRDNWYIFVNAISGEILELYNNTKFDGPATAQAVDLNGINRTVNVYQVGAPYYMIDATRQMWQVSQPDILYAPKGALWTKDARNTYLDSLYNISSSDNTWNDPTSVSAHYNVGKTFEYYYSTFGRNAIDDSGSTIISVIHVTDSSGQSMDNAYWNGKFISYGDGNTAFKPLAGALDVAAHEMTHGVIQHTVNLKYKYQSGALNESFADVFGAMVDRDDWLIGEDVVELAYFPSGAMRNMQDPHNGASYYGDTGWQPSHMEEFQDLEQDNGGVHINSGIVNRAAYLIGSALGKDKLEQIYYRVMYAHYLSRQGKFFDMRLAAIQAASDLYGDPSIEVNAVMAAFDVVGIYDGPGTEQPPDIEPVVGEGWIAVVNAEPTDSSLYLVKPDMPPSVLNQLTSTQVFTGAGCPISVDRDGTGMVFIDSANFIRAINTDGTGEVVISAMGEWSSIALSPDGGKLAATTIYVDSTIYIFDLVNSDSSKAIHLYSPTTVEGTNLDITLYADALDWNLTGEYVLYDAFNSVPQSGGGANSYWDINVVDVASSIILPVFPPLPDGINFGNPAFASTNDIFLVFDLIDTNTGTDYITGVNLFTGDISIIEDNGISIGFPEFSADDSRIVFQRIVGSDKTLWQIKVDSTKIVPSGLAEEWVVQASLPTWFTIASTVGIDEPEESQILPGTFSLSQNYPNPFNPVTNIEFNLPGKSNVTLDIYNIMGQRVKTLLSRELSAGSHTVEWDGSNSIGEPVASGVYFYQLISDDLFISKKMILLK